MSASTCLKCRPKFHIVDYLVQWAAQKQYGQFQCIFIFAYVKSPHPIRTYTLLCYTLSAWLSIGCLRWAWQQVTPPSPPDRLQQPRDPERIISSDRKWMDGIANYTSARPQGVLQQWPFWWFIDLWLNTVLMCGWLAPCNPCVLPSWARARRCRQHSFSAHSCIVATFTPQNQTVTGMNTNPYMNYWLW